jgi:hypothetical protein
VSLISRSRHPAYERAERQRFAVVIGPVLEKKLGSLVAAAEMLRRLDVAGIIDGLCPIRDIADLTHGQVIEAMVANRLSAPAPLVGLEDWAREWAVGEVFAGRPGAAQRRPGRSGPGCDRPAGGEDRG